VKLKKIGKDLVCRLLEAQVKALRKKYDFKVIAVVGSVGKTSTKLSIANMLSNSSRVMFQNGNYNDRLTVPLVVFGQLEPSIYNVFAWRKILKKNRRIIKDDYPYDYVVLELGPDGPNQLKYFKYLKPDLVVLTAIAAEHMEYFKTLDNVAKEELLPLSFSKEALVNVDDTDPKYLRDIKYKSYGNKEGSDYQIIDRKTEDLKGQRLSVNLNGSDLKVDIKMLGEQGAKIALAAASVADILGWDKKKIKNALSGLSAVPGRMQLLDGINDSVLIDDTYNASPIAVKAALDVLGSLKASSRIAILGSMNELGPVSHDEHVSVGEYCDPSKLDIVITIGSEAQKFLAPAATKSGCRVVSFNSPYEAGEYVKAHLKENSVVLAKGSQNGVFAEEALKLLLKKPSDQAKLVRQSNYWLAVKRKQFN
jgi:UDP-N-acetylmuramoyl-tripeptide--D-alanyl-D-alanine ligase